MDISNRSPFVPQEYSSSGIVSARNINMLGRSVNDLETVGNVNINRNPVGGNIFTEETDYYHFQLYSPFDYDPAVEGSTATIQMYWGVWNRSSKYTFSRVALTVEPDLDNPGNDLLYKIVSLTSNAMNWVYVRLNPPDSPARNAQYLETLNKPYTLDAYVVTTTPVQFGGIQKIDVPDLGLNLANMRLIGMVYVDINGVVSWVEQCWKNDISELASWYEGPFKLEMAGKGGNSASTALTTPEYNTGDASTGDGNHQFYPYGTSVFDQVIVGQGVYQHSGNKQVVFSPSAGYKTVDLSDPLFAGNSVSIGVVIRLRSPGTAQTDSDVSFCATSHNASQASNVWNNPLTPRSQDSFIFTQTLGYANVDSNGLIQDLKQLTHDDIIISKYCNDYAGYYTDPYDATRDQVVIDAGWIIGPYDNYKTPQTTVTLPDVNTEAPVGFTGTYYDLLVYHSFAINVNTAVISTGTVGYTVASQFRETGRFSWCDFSQSRGYQRTPIGIARYMKDSATTPANRWVLVDWIQMQRGHITSHYWASCGAYYGASSTHYTGIITDSFVAGCAAFTTTTTTCAAS